MNATQFCQLVEARLGWLPPSGGPWFKRYQAEARKVRTKQKTAPDYYTFENLCLAVEYLARQRLMRTPIGVFSYVTPALHAAAAPEIDLEREINDAMRAEAAKGDPDGWAERLSRAVGPYRAEVLAEWRALR